VKSPRKLIRERLESLGYKGSFDVSIPARDFGDYSTNVALITKEEPRDIKDKLIADKEVKEMFSKINVESNRFINFFLSKKFLQEALTEVIKSGPKYGNSDFGKGQKINVEFVSANPTGPLTIGNARGGVFGDILGNVFKKVGFEVSKEYYINDIGRQVKILGESIARRYLQLGGRGINFPEDNYQGEYIADLAREMREKKIFHGSEDNFDELADACRDFALEKINGWMKEALNKIGVNFDTWFSEKSLHDGGKVDDVLKALKFGDMVYEKDNATWLKIDGENDAVLIKSTGDPTYLLVDFAYSKDKFTRGAEIMINIWGSDHYGDVARLKYGLIEGLGYKPEQIEILLYQHVTLKDAGKMSKRAGQFVTLDELTDDVGKDVVRYFFASKSQDTHMNFDLALAKEESKQNPVFYIQYANARINSLFNKIKDEKLEVGTDFSKLEEKEEMNLIKRMIILPDLLEDIATKREIHHLANYALDLANDFHSFYEKHKILTAEKKIAEARLGLIFGVLSVFKVVLDLLGISAPDRM